MTELTPQTSPLGEEVAMMGESQTRPSEEVVEDAMQAAGDIDEAMPDQMPPEMEEALSEAATVWHNGKKIISLWSTNQNRNSWIGVSGLGWKKLANNSDSAVVALTMLASHAKQSNRNVKLREDAGQIKEIYVL